MSHEYSWETATAEEVERDLRQWASTAVSDMARIWACKEHACLCGGYAEAHGIYQFGNYKVSGICTCGHREDAHVVVPA